MVNAECKMEKAKENPILEKSYAFALRIIEAGKYLQSDMKEFVLSRQVIRAGTSIGANVEEATASLSRKDFAARMGVLHRRKLARLAIGCVSWAIPATWTDPWQIP